MSIHKISDIQLPCGYCGKPVKKKEGYRSNGKAYHDVCMFLKTKEEKEK